MDSKGVTRYFEIRDKFCVIIVIHDLNIAPQTRLLAP